MDGVTVALNWYVNNNLNVMFDWAYDNRYDLPSRQRSRLHQRLRHQGAVPVLARASQSRVPLPRVMDPNLKPTQYLEHIPMLKTIPLLVTLAMTATIGLPSQGGEPACGANPNCAAGCDSTCSHCGCKLVPVCHCYCTTKKVTEYKYTCICTDMCVPPVTPICGKCRCQDGDGSGQSGQCGGCAGNSQNGCGECCAGHCTVHEVRKLVKYPVTKEVPVRKCSVEWVCPHCQGNCGCVEDATPSAAPSAAPSKTPSAPLPPAPRAAAREGNLSAGA